MAPEDLNRYVSSASTVPTMMTTVSTSFVKHRGPAAGAARKVKDVITYESVQKQLPHQVGKMIFDRQQMKWIRAEPPSRLTEEEVESGGSGHGSGHSEDPFAGLDSLCEERRAPGSQDNRAETLPPVEEHEKPGATMLSHWSEDTDDQSDAASGTDVGTAAATMGNLSLRTAQTEHADVAAQERVLALHIVKPSLDQAFQFGQHQETRPPLIATQNDPTPLTAATPAKLPATTPISVLKKRMQAIDPQTPINTSSVIAGGSLDRRSVSFSDGRKSGKILDVLVHNANHRKRRSWNSLAKPDKQGVFSVEGPQQRTGGQSTKSGLMRELTAAMDESGEDASIAPICVP